MYAYIVDGVNNPYWVDITSSLTTQINIPVWTRNNNGTPTAEGFTLSLVDTIGTTILQNIKFVKFSIDNAYKFFGVIDKKNPDTTKRIWEYEVFNGFYELTKFKIEDAEIGALLRVTSDPYKYFIGDTGGENSGMYYENVSVPWLLEVLLNKNGLPADASALYLENSENIVESRPANYYLKDIRLDINMLYCINQDVGARYGFFDQEFQSEYKFAEKKVKAFDLFVLICGVFSITIRLNSSGTYILERRKSAQTNSEKYTVNQSDIYDYSFSNKEAGDIKSYEMKACARTNYYNLGGVTEINPVGVNVQAPGGSVTWYNNLVFLMQDKNKAVGQTMNFDNLLVLWRLNSLYFVDGSLDEFEESFECPIQDSFYNVKKHFINPRTERSIITQGVLS